MRTTTTAGHDLAPDFAWMIQSLLNYSTYQRCTGVVSRWQR